MRSRVRLILAFFMGTFVMLCFLIVYVSTYFVAGIILLIPIFAVALMSVSCPKCGHSVLYRKGSAFGTEFMGFSAMPPLPTVCSECGEQLT